MPLLFFAGCSSSDEELSELELDSLLEPELDELPEPDSLLSLSLPDELPLLEPELELPDLLLVLPLSLLLELLLDSGSGAAFFCAKPASDIKPR